MTMKERGRERRRGGGRKEKTEEWMDGRKDGGEKKEGTTRTLKRGRSCSKRRQSYGCILEPSPKEI